MTRKARIDPERKALALQNLEELQSATNHRGGEQATKLIGTSGRWPEEKIIRTGSVDLDMSIGIGGIPRGRIHEIYGVESAGKTTLVLHVVAEAQRAGMNVLYIDAESALDPNYTKKLGVDLDLMLINQPNSLEAAIDLMAHSMEASLTEDANDLLILVDSIPALAGASVYQDSAEQQTRALAARIWSQQMPKLVKLAGRSNSTIILINQMRDGMDMWTPQTTPGGRAIKFAASLRIELKRKVEDKKSDAGSTGQTVSFKVVKNKVGSPFKGGTFWLPAGKPIKWENDVISTAMAWGSSGLIQADWKGSLDGGEKKNGWFSLQLRPEWVDLMIQDELEEWLATDGQPDEKGTIQEHTEENFDFTYDADGLREKLFITEYREGKFRDELLNYPSLIEAIEDALLDTLNEGTAIDDVEGTAESESGQEALEAIERGEEIEEPEDEDEQESA